MIEKNKNKNIMIAALTLFIAAVMLLSVGIWRKYHIFSAEDFGFTDLVSPNDADGDGVDDYSDMVDGARAYIATNPLYESAYYAGGYPNDGKGVCTDVIWNAFKAAGYSLKDLVDADIAARTDEYFDGNEKPDPNIDFRRCRNLLVFFKKHAEVLTTSTANPEDWMSGDIVLYDGHIALCSDKRNAQGLPYIIHHGNPVEGAVEVDALTTTGYGKIIGHFRWVPNN